MNEKLSIMLFPDESDMDSHDNAVFKQFTFSTASKIFINKTNDLYHINYRISDFLQLDMSKLSVTLTNVFKKNMPGVKFNLTIITQMITHDIVGDNAKTLIRKTNECNSAFTNSDNINVVNPGFKFADIDSDVDSEDQLPNSYGEDDESYYDQDDIDEDEFDPDDMEDTMDTIYQVLGMGSTLPGNDNTPVFADYKDHHTSKFTKNTKKSYPSSRILKSADHPKRDVKRYDIIIESGKARDKDADIIMSFLKQFIPGNSSWIKSYRKVVLRRWINQYSITKKTARKISKKYKNTHQAVNKKKGNISVDRVSRATSNILKRYDAFYDTSK
jgi:hypothetical protein